MSFNTSFNPTRRRILVWVGLIFAVILLAWQLSRLDSTDQTWANDSVEYWAAGVLARSGGNPYNPEQLLPLQQSVGWSADRALMMWNPPWILPIAILLSLLPYAIARTVWMAFLLVILLICVNWFWAYYAGPPRYRFVAWLLSVLFFPCILVLKLGQITPLILLGVLLFLHFERKGQWWYVGGATVLMTIKPQLFVPFGVILLLWTLQTRRWQLLAGASLTGTLLIAPPLLFNPAILRLYLLATTQTPPTDWATPTLGGVIRFLGGFDHTWLQFLPVFLGLVWTLHHWSRHRKEWDWRQQTPLLLLASLFFTGYGWTYDHVLLIPVLMQVGTWAVSDRLPFSNRQLFLIFGAINGSVMLNLFNLDQEFGYFWLLPLWFALYLFLRRRLLPTTLDKSPQTAD